VIFEAPALRALTETLWVEEYALLVNNDETEGLLLVMFAPGERLPTRVIKLSQRLDCSMDESKLFGLDVITISSLLRVDVILLSQASDVFKIIAASKRRLTPVEDMFIDDTMRWGKRRLVLNTRHLFIPESKFAKNLLEECSPCELSCKLLLQVSFFSF